MHVCRKTKSLIKQFLDHKFDGKKMINDGLMRLRTKRTPQTETHPFQLTLKMSEFSGVPPTF